MLFLQCCFQKIKKTQVLKMDAKNNLIIVFISKNLCFFELLFVHDSLSFTISFSEPP